MCHLFNGERYVESDCCGVPGRKRAIVRCTGTERYFASRAKNGAALSHCRIVGPTKPVIGRDIRDRDLIIKWTRS